MDLLRIYGVFGSVLALFINISQSVNSAADCITQSKLQTELEDNLQIVCVLSNLNDQTFSVYWAIVRNSRAQRINPSPNSKYQETIDRTSSDVAKVTLTINNVDIEDAGIYQIDFTGIDIKSSVTSVIQGAPRITNQFKTVYGRPGFELLLDCRVQSWPYPTGYRWYFRNQLVYHGGEYQIYDQTYRDRSISHSYLKILNFNTSHTGTYVCFATNKIGEDSKELEAWVGKDENIECSVQYKCNDLQTCNLDHGCLCVDGYRERADGSCVDINECVLNIHNCEQECVNLQSSYKCECYSGYVKDKTSDKCIEYVPPPKAPVDNKTVYAIVGVVIIIVLIIFILIVVYVYRKRREKRKSPTPPPQYVFDKSTTPSASIVHELSVNKVEIQHEIGMGRFGKVFLARAWDITGTGTWEPVAVKQSRHDLTEQDRSAFLHELNLVKRIPYNRHIVKCLGYFSEPMMSMLLEYMPYGDLLTYLRQNRPHNFRISSSSLESSQLTASHIFNFALQCARGIQHLHENKIIHRDLAARNILVADENCCKISDFGMARKVGEDYSYTSKSSRPLPILWMAPEAVFNNRSSNKSDTWSFGVLFWEMVTLGSRPYPGKSGNQVLDMLQQGQIMEQPLHCASEIYRILTNCWQWDPKNRPEFHELVDEIEIRMEFASNYVALNNYNFEDYNFIDHVSMSDLDLDRSEDNIQFITRTRSRQSLRSLNKPMML